MRVGGSSSNWVAVMISPEGVYLHSNVGRGLLRIQLRAASLRWRNGQRPLRNGGWPSTDRHPCAVPCILFLRQGRRTPMAPERLSHYRVIRKIGEGGMGEVYLAEDEILGRRVAVKVLPDAVAGDPERLVRFRYEARAISALNHPNIVTIHELGVDGSRHFIVTEYIAGTTLREVMQRSASGAEIIGAATSIAA